MNWYATFSGNRYHATTQRIVEDAPKFGADRVLVFDNVWLKTCRPGFCKGTEYFFKHHQVRGVNWFAFKPFTVLDAFRRMNDGDVLLYSDGDTAPIADLRPLYQRCRDDGGVMLFNALACKNRQWVKRDAYVLMGCDEPKYHDGDHAVARFMLFQKGGTFPVEKFLTQWLAYTTNPMVNTFDPSVLAPELEGFKEGRAEQAVLSLLAIQYGLKLYREACQFGEGVDDDRELYPQTFEQSGSYSYDPAGPGQGSRFRNVLD